MSTFEEALEAVVDRVLTRRLPDIARAVVQATRPALEALREDVIALRRAQPPRLVDVVAASEMTGLSVRTIRRRISTGELPTVRIGRSVRVDTDALRPADPRKLAAEARLRR